MYRIFGRRLVSSANKLIVTRACLATPHCVLQSTMMSQSELKVVHDGQGNEFYIKLEDEKGSVSKAVLTYEYLTDNHVDLQHTEVPVEFRGKGVAKILAQTVFDHFVDRKVDITPTCTYLQKFYNDNPLPKYKDRVKME